MNPLCSRWLEATLEKVNALQQGILMTPGQVNDPLQAIRYAYEQLSDPDKIAFLLVGGVPQLLRHQQQAKLLFQQERKGISPFGPETGGLPILAC